MIEICANSIESAMAAQRGGAGRVELCSELEVGGVTPSHGMISIAKKVIDIALNVLIRPRRGDFLYDEWENEEVLRNIRFCGKLGVNGVVVGALTKNRKIDKSLCGRWIDLAHDLGMSVTFHRAIDCTADIFEAMEDVISLECDRILTSGGHPTAYQGKDVIKKMVEQSAGRIIIMPGSGVNPSNILELRSHTGASEFHFSASRKYPSKMEIREEGDMPDIVYPDEPLIRSDDALVRQAVELLK